MKLVLLAVRKEDTHSTYILEKDQNFFPLFRKFIGALETYEMEGWGKAAGDKGEPLPEDLSVFSLADHYEHLYESPDGIDTQIIYGAKKIFVTFFHKPGQEQKIANAMFEISEFTSSDRSEDQDSQDRQ